MIWKVAFVLMLASVAMAALVASEPEDVVAAEQEAVKRLNALREHLFLH